MYYQVIDDTLWIGSTNWEGAKSGTIITNNSIINIKCKNVIIKGNFTVNSTSCVNCYLNCFNGYYNDSYEGPYGINLNCNNLSNIEFSNGFSGKLSVKSSALTELVMPSPNYNGVYLELECSNLTNLENLNGIVGLKLKNCVKLTELNLDNCFVIEEWLGAYASGNGEPGYIDNCGISNLRISFISSSYYNFVIKNCSYLENIIFDGLSDHGFSLSNLPSLKNVSGFISDSTVNSLKTKFPNVNIYNKIVAEGRDNYTVSINNYYTYLRNTDSNDYSYNNNATFYRRLPCINNFADNGIYNVPDGTLFHLKGEKVLWVEMAGALIVDSRGVMSYKEGNDIKFPVNDNLTVYIIPQEAGASLNAVIKTLANPQ